MLSVSIYRLGIEFIGQRQLEIAGRRFLRALRGDRFPLIDVLFEFLLFG
jgi:hypothetical protein